MWKRYKRVPDHWHTLVNMPNIPMFALLLEDIPV
jgi:hypothetical protein